ncbi:MAG TPA: zinc-ribbon domain-containing protein [Candidatus Limnocylindria bacterium]|nr:zinc-ribbon domain-containing protein [Candidatus Limnocylindria bacterium]
MDHDERDRPDVPEVEPASPAEPVAPDEPIAPSEADASAEAIAPAEPVRPDWTADEPVPSAAEIESWPSQDTASQDAASQDAASQASSGAIDERTAWPTEPPAAGSAPADAWPTSSPERTDPDPGFAAAEPPPSEVEAYPAATASEPDAAPVAAAAAATTAAHAVPDTEGATGESTQCPRCGTENRPGLAFCRNCGQRLVAAGVSTTVERPGTPDGTMACPRCGTHNRAGVAFCQNCGANLRGTAPGYVPPAVAAEGTAVDVEPARRGAILGPVVLLIGVIGLVTAYLLPFLYGNGSLFDRAYGADGYGIAFWNGYPDVGAELADQAYFGLAGPVPVLVLLLVVLAIAGFVRAAPGMLQRIGLVIALLWSVGLVVLFVVVELGGNWGGDLVAVLRALTPAGIIFFLASLIVLIGTLTRFGRA